MRNAFPSPIHHGQQPEPAAALPGDQTHVHTTPTFRHPRCRHHQHCYVRPLMTNITYHRIDYDLLNTVYWRRRERPFPNSWMSRGCHAICHDRHLLEKLTLWSRRILECITRTAMRLHTGFDSATAMDLQNRLLLLTAPLSAVCWCTHQEISSCHSTLSCSAHQSWCQLLDHTSTVCLIRKCSSIVAKQRMPAVSKCRCTSRFEYYAAAP